MSLSLSLLEMRKKPGRRGSALSQERNGQGNMERVLLKHSRAVAGPALFPAARFPGPGSSQPPLLAVLPQPGSGLGCCDP